MGLPEGMQEKVKQSSEADQEEVADATIKLIVPEEQRTGDTKKDLLKAATASGVTDIPASATVDKLNKAIAGAAMGAAIAGNYVNPNTGQEGRQTSGARISNAAMQGLGVQRETASNREAAAQAMALAQAKAAAKPAKAAKMPGNIKLLVDNFIKRGESTDHNDVAAHFNQMYDSDIGTRIMKYLQGDLDALADSTAPAPAAAPEARTPEDMTRQRERATKFIEENPGNREFILKKLEENGVSTEGM